MSPITLSKVSFQTFHSSLSLAQEEHISLLFLSLLKQLSDWFPSPGRVRSLKPVFALCTLLRSLEFFAACRRKLEQLSMIFKALMSQTCHSLPFSTTFPPHCSYPDLVSLFLPPTSVLFPLYEPLLSFLKLHIVGGLA